MHRWLLALLGLGLLAAASVSLCWPWRGHEQPARAPGLASRPPDQPPPPPPPGATHARQETAAAARTAELPSGRWIRGISCAGPSISIHGHVWLSPAEADAQGLRLGAAGIAPGLPATGLDAGLDAGMDALLRSGVAGVDGTVRVTMPLPSGRYLLYLWLSSPQQLSINRLQLHARAVALAPQVAAAGEQWCCLGPVPVISEQGAIDLVLGGMGRAVLCGLAVTAP